MSTSSVERPSTWSDRKLFSGFHGILKDDITDLPMPEPEELPMVPSQMMFGSMTPSLAELLPESAERKALQRKNLTAAGYHSRSSWINLSAVRFTLAFISVIVVGFWLLMAPPALEPWLLGLVIAAPMLAWAIPPLLISSKANERKTDIERGLPDVMDMLNMGVSQGLTVPASLRRIAAEIKPSHPALAEELAIVNQQTQVGSLSQALRNFSDRIDSPEVSSFTSLLMQTESTGTSIAHTLSEYSDSMRNSLRERADSRANAASFKLLFPTALCLMPSVFLFLLGPAIVEMSNFFNNTAETLLEDRDRALDTLDQQAVVSPDDN